MNEPDVRVKPKISEDLWAVWLGVGLALVSLILVLMFGDSLKGWINKPGEWVRSPIELLDDVKAGVPVWASTLVSLSVVGGILAFIFWTESQTAKGLIAFATVACLAVAAMVLAGQEVIKYFNLEYVLWALLIGAIVGNTIGVPAWIKPAVRGEFYIKLGLVLLGMEVLMAKLVVLGLPGILVSWVVTPIVLITTFWIGNRLIKIDSPSLTITIASDMSVCGVSAAIATAAACRAKKEELSLAVSLSLAFTAIMMVVMPLLIRVIGMDDLVGGAWMGGTIDSTGAVAAAGAALGERALLVATTIKMIQNILIGVIAFAVSLYWTTYYPEADSADGQREHTPGFFGEVWKRFPKFVLGFVAVSIVASVIDASGPQGSDLIKQTIDLLTKEIRGWLFCLAFVCIGFEMRWATLAPALKGGKPLLLYIIGQSINLVLTGLMAWLVFGWLFRDAIIEWLPK